MSRGTRWLDELEVVRAAAFVFVVFSHAVWALHDVSHSVATMQYAGVLLALTRPAVPAFLAISGLLIGYRIAGDRDAGFTRSLGRIALAYATWTVIYTFAYPVLDGAPAVSPAGLAARLFRNLLTADASYHLWYVLVAIQVLLVGPPLARWLLGRSSAERWLAVAGATALNIVLLGQVWGPLTGANEVLDTILNRYYDRIVLFWIAYVVLGVVLGLEWERIRAALRRFSIPIAVVYLVACGAVSVLVWVRIGAVAGLYQPSVDVSRIVQPWIVPFEMLSVVAWLMLASLLPAGWFTRAAAFVGTVSLGAYLSHALVLHLFRLHVYQTYPDASPLVLVYGLTLLVAVVSVLLSWGFGQLSVPLSAALGGTRVAHRTEVPERSFAGLEGALGAEPATLEEESTEKRGGARG